MLLVSEVALVGPRKHHVGLEKRHLESKVMLLASRVTLVGPKERHFGLEKRHFESNVMLFASNVMLLASKVTLLASTKRHPALFERFRQRTGTGTPHPRGAAIKNGAIWSHLEHSPPPRATPPALSAPPMRPGLQPVVTMPPRLRGTKG